MVLIPFLITYLTTWTAWYRIDKRKHLTWIACIINLYPQFKAANVIYHLWRNPRKGVAKKRKFEREVSEMEVEAAAAVAGMSAAAAAAEQQALQDLTLSASTQHP